MGLTSILGVGPREVDIELFLLVRQDRTNHMEAVDVYLEKIAAETIAKWLAKTAPL